MVLRPAGPSRDGACAVELPARRLALRAALVDRVAAHRGPADGDLGGVTVGHDFGYQADLGTSSDDALQPPEDENGDGFAVAVGLGGDDTFWDDDLDSGTPKYVIFCGGNGKDRVEGWVWAFNGGHGKDSARLTQCRLAGHDPVLKSVERRHRPTPCPEDMP